MDDIDWLALTGIAMVAILIFPRAIPHVRRGPWLRNAAIWLAVVTALVFLYQAYGPF